MPPRSLTVGIDVGGTFTDLLAIDTHSNEVRLAKVPTTPDNQAIGFMAALAAAGADPAAVQAIVPRGVADQRKGEPVSPQCFWYVAIADSPIVGNRSEIPHILWAEPTRPRRRSLQAGRHPCR